MNCISMTGHSAGHGRKGVSEVQDFEGFMKVLLWACGMIAAVGGAIVTLGRLISPYKELKREVRELRALGEDNKRKLAHDLGRFEENELRDNLMMETLFTLVEHARTNNSTGLMEKTSKKLKVYLIHNKVMKE